jgi:hypothetical protein
LERKAFFSFSFFVLALLTTYKWMGIHVIYIYIFFIVFEILVALLSFNDAWKCQTNWLEIIDFSQEYNRTIIFEEKSISRATSVKIVEMEMVQICLKEMTKKYVALQTTITMKKNSTFLPSQ